VRLRDRHRRLIQVTLAAVAPYGAALGGRNALAVHGLSRQTTKLIDVVTSRDAVPQAAAAVEKALRQAGYQAERQPQTAELENTWPGGRNTATEWHVRKPEPHDHPPIGGIRDYQCLTCFDHDYLGLSRAPRSRDPVHTDLGPVLHAEDAAGQKVCDLARRRLVRDYMSTADLLDHYSPAALIGFARRLDPSLKPRDFADAALRLDQYPDSALAFTCRRTEEVARVRDHFATWPRDARQIGPRRRREHAAPGQDRSDRPQPERPEPAQPAPQERDIPASQPRRTEPARSEPGRHTRAPERSGTDRVISGRGRQRQTDRACPEIGR
jgi:hypothetical protein